METKAEVVKVYKQEVPALRFIGKKYGESDLDPQRGFGPKWEEWNNNGWFEAIEKLIDFNMNTVFEDGDAVIGLMLTTAGKPYEYWIGKFMPAGTAVPDGYDYRDFPAATLGVSWKYGNWGNMFNPEECPVMEKLAQAGYKPKAINGDSWYFERYVKSRFSPPDEKGNFILDYCHFVEDGKSGMAEANIYSEITIAKLPKMKIAKHRVISSNPEDEAIDYMNNWVKQSGLLDVKDYTPRKFGWDYPNLTDEQKAGNLRGYEYCYTIPEDFAPKSDGVDILHIEADEYAVMRITDPMNNPHISIPGGWKKLSEFVDSGEYKTTHWNNRYAMEEIIEINGVTYMDIYFPVK
ncbi:MAG: GyrI-like domain-containing protein [Fibromonadaceae bacterium]|jgi:DNA gyrase inhibitor GyrI|nr:GyrI-like domain-containing protein [Fibromonadaceae bacterium]